MLSQLQMTFTRAKARLHAAYYVFEDGGSLSQVGETLFYGDYTDDFSIETYDPLYHSPNWDKLLDTIGLTFIDREKDVTLGNNMSYDFQDKGAIKLSINVDDKNPAAHFTLNSRIWYAYFSIRQNPDNDEFQVDHAFIGDKRHNPAHTIDEDADDSGERINMSTESNDEGRELLPLFFEAFTDIGTIITSHTLHLTPHDVERKLTEYFSPICLRLQQIDEEHKRAIQYELANGGVIVDAIEDPHI